MNKESEAASGDSPVKGLKVEAVTNFQLVPDNAGVVLLLGRRSYAVLEGLPPEFPKPTTDMFVAGYMSHTMAKDLAVILARFINDFETSFGKIPLPGVDPEKPLPTEEE